MINYSVSINEAGGKENSHPGQECQFCNGCDNIGGGRTETFYQPYIDGEKELREINAEYIAGKVKG